MSPTKSQSTPYTEMASTTSPWTELFQPTHRTRKTTMSMPDTTTKSASRAQTESNQPTHDALSAIFNHD